MKKQFLLLSALMIFSVTFSQTVENIRVEPEGDNIKINYRIGGSLENHVYNVQLTCSIDGGPVFEPKTVIGDVGQNIRGGKSYYTILWDVFEDRDEIGDAEFFIKVDLVEGTIQQYEQPGTFTEPAQMPLSTAAPLLYRKRFITYELNYWCPVGIRFGSLGNWGYELYTRGGSDAFDEFTGWISVGPTKRIVNGPKYRLHGFIGLGMGVFEDEAKFDYEFGFSNVIANRVVLNLGWSYWTGVALGLGIAF